MFLGPWGAIKKKAPNYHLMGD